MLTMSRKINVGLFSVVFVPPLLARYGKRLCYIIVKVSELISNDIGIYSYTQSIARSLCDS